MQLTNNSKANTSFYDLEMPLNNGKSFSFSELRGKKVILVNTASACGFTPQYDGLQKLHQEHGNNLSIIGFPSNEFGAQEQGDDKAIDEFCRVNFGVTFPLMKKSSVKKGAEQNPVFKWLTDKNANGWNDQEPTWNFCKYIINENGDLTHFFEASADPAEKTFKEAVGV